MFVDGHLEPSVYRSEFIETLILPQRTVSRRRPSRYTWTA